MQQHFSLFILEICPPNIVSCVQHISNTSPNSFSLIGHRATLHVSYIVKGLQQSQCDYVTDERCKYTED